VVGAASSYYGAASGRGAARQLAANFREAEDFLNPRRIAKVTRRLIPLYRELIAGGAGPKIQDDIATILARSGLSDTGAADAIRALGEQAPGIFAFQQALSSAYDIQSQRAAQLLGAPVSPGYNPIGETLAGGARGFIGGGGLNLGKKTTSTDDEYPGLFPVGDDKFVA
jgi:hypothetical protein